MNEEVKKIIKASFCPKEKWIKDDDAATCFKCDKKFHPLFRRKHHCRYCGQVFCATYFFPYEGVQIFHCQGKILDCQTKPSGCVRPVSKNVGSISPNMTTSICNFVNRESMRVVRSCLLILSRYSR